jgi:hypothetical protein
MWNNSLRLMRFISMSASRLMSIELVVPHAGLLLTDLANLRLQIGCQLFIFAAEFTN